ncbi:MAG: hypothetical protein ABIN91_13625 [Mucilaginibacter sp.]|uniref:hypothetical protein n=1 Tax=Mucilaginibacter sp. TaxID=1882438 RepID=UPI003263A572
MTAVDKENKVAELKDWAQEAMELLDEVKPYRSIFYKQRVAKLKEMFKHITLEGTAAQLRSGTQGSY